MADAWAFWAAMLSLRIEISASGFESSNTELSPTTACSVSKDPVGVQN